MAIFGSFSLGELGEAVGAYMHLGWQVFGETDDRHIFLPSSSRRAHTMDAPSYLVFHVVLAHEED
eukprot:CAMPEP_0196666570 /NCGR_PEP_ID=MMETSP1086-20130531/64588_1 /TAXON_ID=77921 /ORGANISM="Cyanoptyche  gloeocystis , Strain SAG4.97" /LENGTH=64 /DNA_ID=CAMNT_0042003781 /DNA_START=1038 /DNA_END=1232 /DNA_ORIENTATION=+